MKKKQSKETLFQITSELHEKICDTPHKSWYGKDFLDTEQQNDEVKNILKSIDKIYDSRSLFKMVSELHVKMFGASPIMWGFHSFDDITAKEILQSIAENIPYDQTPEGYDPNDPKWRGAKM
jgi:hypothetical protein